MVLRLHRAFARSPETDAGKFQLPISLELFDRVSQVLDISPAFLAVINTGVASFTVSLKRKNRTTVQGSERKISFEPTHIYVAKFKQQN